MYATYTTAKN